MSDAWGDPDPSRAWRAADPPAGGQPPVPPAGGPPPAAPAPLPPSQAYYPLPTEQVHAWAYYPPPRVPLAQRLLATARAARDAAVVAAYVALLGAPVAFAWRAVVPAVQIAHSATGPQPVAAESSQIFGVDGSFVLVTLVVGLVAGALAWPVLRRRGPAGPVGIAAGGLLAALAAAGVGRKMVVDRYLYDFCQQRGAHCGVYSGTLRLQSYAAVVVWPAAMLVVFAALTLLLTREDRAL